MHFYIACINAIFLHAFIPFALLIAYLHVLLLPCTPHSYLYSLSKLSAFAQIAHDAI